jgi:hypothetical protein
MSMTGSSLSCRVCILLVVSFPVLIICKYTACRKVLAGLPVRGAGPPALGPFASDDITNYVFFSFLFFSFLFFSFQANIDKN